MGLDTVSRMGSYVFIALGAAVGLPGCTETGGERGDGDECPAASASELEAQKIDVAPSVDGLDDDPAWNDCRSVLEVDVSANVLYQPSGSPTSPSYPGLETTTVRMQAAYTDSDVYFLVQWEDPTLSLERYPWVKQGDGTWIRLTNKDASGHENTYYEDKFAVQWNVSNSSFETLGCTSSCHPRANMADEHYPGYKYNSPGALTDMWHWKSVRTNPNFQLDDKHVVGLAEEGNGRKGDSKKEGGYKENINDQGESGYDDASCPASPFTTVEEDKAPCFMGPEGSERVTHDEYWILDEEKQNFMDEFVEGDVIAGLITSAFVGSRGDVEARGEYVDGTWTLEIRRSLTTESGEAEDVQFDDLDADYHFGVAVFDNTQINHAVHGGALTFRFAR